jgi:hypothetical protein
LSGLVKNNEPLFFSTFIRLSKSWKKADETKKAGGRARYTSPSLPLVVIIIIKNREFNRSFSTSLSIS